MRGKPRFVVRAYGLLQLYDDRLLFRRACFRGEAVFWSERDQRETND